MPVISSLNLTITPSSALYTQPVPDSAITVNDSVTQGRHAIILDFNNTEGLYVRDLGTIFQFPLGSGTVLDLWQPSVAPMDGEIYDRLSYHFLMTSLGGEGWQTAREMNIAYASTATLSLRLDFGDGAYPKFLLLTLPSSAGLTTKAKLTLPANKWKMIEGFLSSTLPFKMWTNDMELKAGTWGRFSNYRVAKPFAG